MSTYLGKSINEVGDIRRNKYVYDEANKTYTYSSIPIKAVFKNFRLIWPIVSKFKFWVSQDPEDMEYKYYAHHTIHVKAGWKKTEGSKPTSEPHPITIYVRSCSRSGRLKYPFHVDSLNDWVTIENTTDTSADIDPNEQEIPKDAKYDGYFTIYIKNNTHRTERGTRVRVYQIDPSTGLPTRNDDLVYIEIIQDGDEQYSGADFSNGVVAATWYTDSNFNVLCNAYGDNLGNGAEMTNGETDVYVQITGQSWMWSGTTQPVYFGNNGEYLTPSSFISSNYLYNAYDITYLGYGRWKATLKWYQNEATDASKKNTISNLQISPTNEVNWTSHTVTVSFDLNVTGMSYARKMPVTLQIPSSSEWTGNGTLENSVYCWQNGGEVNTPITGANPSITPDIAANNKWVKRSSQGMTSDGNTYKETFNVSASELVTKSHIEDEKLIKNRKQVYYIGATDTDITLAFKVLYNNEVYEERVCTFTVKYLETTEKINLTQKGEDVGNYYKITRYTNPEILTDKLMKIALTTTEDVFITSMSEVYYNQDYWRVDLKIAENPKKVIDPAIKITDVPQYLTSDIHNNTSNQVYIQWQVVSGEVNSEARENILSVVCTSIKLDDEVDLIQQGTADAVATIYHDTEKCTLVNKQDNKTWTNSSADTSTHTYKSALIVDENNECESVVALTMPTKIVNWNQDVLNNDITSTVYIQVSGYPAHKGIDRYVEITISTPICKKAADTSILQEKKEYVLEKDNEVWCEDLTKDDFTILDGSEAEYNKFNPIQYNGNGWYALLLDVKKNTTPTSYTHHIIVNTSDMIDTGYSYNVHEYLSDTRIPLSAWWSTTGSLIERKAVINVAKIDDINLDWPEVPYTGEAFSHATYDTDWKLEQTEGWSWASYDTKNHTIVISKNKTLEKRTATLEFTFWDGETQILQTYVVSIVQDPMQSIEDLGYVIKTNNEKVILYEVDGTVDTQNILIESHDGEWSACDVTIEGGDGLTIKKYMIENYGVMLKISTTSHLYNTAHKMWTLTINQLSTDAGSYTGKKTTVKVCQASYKLSAILTGYGDTVSLDSTSKPVSLSVMSVVETDTQSIWTPVTVEADDYSWLEIGKETKSTGVLKTYSCTVTHINDSSSTLSAVVTISQNATGQSRQVVISNKNWQASEFDESWIELYYPTTIEKNFWSVVDNTTLPLNKQVKIWDKNGGDPTWVTTSIEKDAKKSYKLVLKNNSILEGTIPQTDVIRINNTVYGIGSCRVTKHAFEWSCSSEEKDGVVIYVSATAYNLWSMYYVKSTMDGLDVDFELVGVPTGVKVTKSGGSLQVLPLLNNNSSYRKKYSMTLKQSMSGQTMQITIYQLSKEEEEKYQVYV